MNRTWSLAVCVQRLPSGVQLCSQQHCCHRRGKLHGGRLRSAGWSGCDSRREIVQIVTRIFTTALYRAPGEGSLVIPPLLFVDLAVSGLQLDSKKEFIQSKWFQESLIPPGHLGRVPPIPITFSLSFVFPKAARVHIYHHQWTLQLKVCVNLPQHFVQCQHRWMSGNQG